MAFSMMMSMVGGSTEEPGTQKADWLDISGSTDLHNKSALQTNSKQQISKTKFAKISSADQF